jgi:hypothetical protein
VVWVRFSMLFVMSGASKHDVLRSLLPDNIIKSTMSRLIGENLMQKFLCSRILLALLLFGTLAGCNKQGNQTYKANTGNEGVAVAQANTEWELGPFEDLKGVETLYAPISTDGQDGGSSFGRRSGSVETHNYLFTNLTDKSFHFLLPNHQSLLTEIKILSMGEGKSPETAKWLYLHHITTDTNNDKALTVNDAFSVGFANADGTNYQDVVIGIDQILREMRRGKDKYLLIYHKQKSIHIAEIDIPSRSVLVDNSLTSLDAPTKK